jgi:two-component system sensor kinase FixL
VGELGQLVTALVHEVNQPLSAIRNYNSGLQRVIESGAYDLAPRAVKGIGDEVKRADEIIRRLREFARKGVPAVQGENLADIVKEAIELASINPAAKGVVFRTQLVDMTSRVLVDRIQVQQVMFNLIRNALEAMEGRQQRILTVESAAKGDQMIEVSVADTGRGIPDQLLGELFKPFVTTKATGMGVGLSVCRMIVEGHGGELTAETRADVGTVFRMTLQREPSERIGDQQTSRR